MKTACLLFLLISGISAAAQETCVSQSKTLPGLLNLHLETSPEQVQAIVGRSLKIKIKGNGERTFFANFIDKNPPPTLLNVRAIYLRFYDRRLYQIEIFFEDRVGWQNLTDFTIYLRDAMILPAAWQTKKGRSEIRCEQISIVADHVLNPRVEITDETTRTQIEKARKKKK
ncbi:MAG TPA: hypothetical protein VGC76_17410 [Pyrinomonadaceae bacterium]